MGGSAYYREEHGVTAALSCEEGGPEETGQGLFERVGWG